MFNNRLKKAEIDLIVEYQLPELSHGKVVLKHLAISDNMSLFGRCWSLFSPQLARPLLNRTICTTVVARPTAMPWSQAPLAISTLFGS